MVDLSKDMPPHDEIGVDPETVVECDACGYLYVEGSWHYCPKGDHVGDVPAEVREDD